jgi:hypothetical protein
MRGRSPVIPLLFFFGLTAGCMRTLPPMPGVAVVASAKAAAIDESAAASGDPTQETETEEADDEADYAMPCKTGSLAQRSAELALSTLDQQIRRLAVAADPTPIEEELEKLLDHPCFELAKVDSRELLDFANAVSLRHWWHEGGSDWLWSYLNVADRRSLRIAPTPRFALTLETAPKDHPLRPLLCPDDAAVPCAVESAGWARRTNEKLELLGNRQHRGKDEIDCAEEAAKEPKAERYAAYRECLEPGFERHAALPIGRFKAPSDGWLVIEDGGRACTHLRAFDLVTGSVYGVDDCSNTPKALTGRVPVGALREAAWMLVLAGEAQRNVRPAQGFHVPENIPIKRTRGESIGLGTISCGCGPSHVRSWSWMREKNGAMRGQISGVVRGGGDDDAIRHAFDLLEIAEAALERGCAASPPPARIAWGSPGPSSKEAEAAVMDEPTTEPLRAALVKARAPRTCTAKP